VRPLLPAPVTLNVHCSETPRIWADPNRLAQVLINLMLNAKDAMPYGGTMTITTSVEDKAVHFRVADTGEGIARENLDRIFEPSFTTKKRAQASAFRSSTRSWRHMAAASPSSELGKGTAFDVAIPVTRE
jgi:signal transduction histidine kinase